MTEARRSSYVEFPSNGEYAIPIRSELIDVRTDVYQFEHASVKVEVSPKGKLISIRVQCSDAYRYQRELFVGKQRTPGTNDYTYGWSAYLHPFHGQEGNGETTEGITRRFMARFLELIEKYPSLMFNATDEIKQPGKRPRAEGFVLLHTRLLFGAGLTVALLDS